MPAKRILTTCIQCTFFILFLMHSKNVTANGKIVTKVNVSTAISYENNYFLSPNNERSVWGYHLVPGIEFGYKTPKSKLLLNYLLKANWYEERDNPPEGELDMDELNYVGHDMKFAANTQLTDRLNIAFKNDFILTRDPGSLDYYSNEIIRHKYTKNIFEPQLVYQFVEKFSVGAKYRHTNIDYKNNTTDEDSKENKGIFDVYYNLNSLNTVNLQYQYWEKEYERLIPAYTSHQISLTFKRELKYYNYSFSGGYQKRTFENNIQENMDGFIWAMSLAADRPEMLFTLSQNINDTSIENDYYLATRFNGSLGHTFQEKLRVKLKGYYQYSNYLRNIENREDNTGKISCELTYMKNELLSFGIEAGVETRDSSAPNNDYENVFVLAGIKLNYDVGSK